MDTHALKRYCDEAWPDSVLPALMEYIRIPNKSPAFDADWAAHGHMDEVAERFSRWALAAGLRGMTVEIVRLPGRTPLLFMDIPATGDSPEVVLLYGHLDKQPEMSGWRDGLGPWQPVIEGDRLYGRGAADDGYAMFACITALKALHQQGLPHARCVIIIEACEESGSYDLPHYIAHLRERIGSPSLVVCLDSGCGNFEQLWVTTSLRGLIGGVLTVEVLAEGVHSGDASGIVPSAFSILRELLGRLEDSATGRVLPAPFQVPIPAQRVAQAHLAAEVLGDGVHTRFPFVPGGRPLSDQMAQLILNRTWRPSLAITGMDGLPAMECAGNVLQPVIRAKVSLRLPPGCDGGSAAAALGRLFEASPPHDARIRFTTDWTASGWYAPVESAWLADALSVASQHHFGRPPVYMGEGGTIPFMAMLGSEFPQAQFVVTGVLGPRSNAHGPNEFLHLPTARKLTCCIAEVLARHGDRRRSAD